MEIEYQERIKNNNLKSCSRVLINQIKNPKDLLFQLVISKICYFKVSLLFQLPRELHSRYFRCARDKFVVMHIAHKPHMKYKPHQTLVNLEDVGRWKSISGLLYYEISPAAPTQLSPLASVVVSKLLTHLSNNLECKNYICTICPFPKFSHCII